MEATTDTLPEPAADPMAGTLCPSCGAVPHIVTGLPVFVTFTADGVATVGVDTAELGDLRADEFDYAHADGCPGITDTERDALLPAVLRLAEQVAKVAEPSVDVTL